MIGALGWLIVIPTLLGVFVGRYLDLRFGTGIFWSGALIFIGVSLGGYLAWQRISTDDRTKQRIEHGRRIRAILTQPQYRPLDILEEVALLLAVDKGLLDDLSLDETGQFQAGLAAWLSQDCARLSVGIATSGSLSEDDQDTLVESIRAFVDQVSASAKTEGLNE